MDQHAKEMVENEVQQEITEAILRAAQEGQPVREICEAVKAGCELHVWFERQPNGRYVLVISTDEKE